MYTVLLLCTLQYICDFREYTEYNIIELVHTVEIPVAILRYPYSAYKYCVFSKPVDECMESPFEFITGYDWSCTGKVIDRSLRLLDSCIVKESEYTTVSAYSN